MLPAATEGSLLPILTNPGYDTIFLIFVHLMKIWYGAIVVI